VKAGPQIKVPLPGTREPAEIRIHAPMLPPAFGQPEVDSTVNVNLWLTHDEPHRSHHPGPA
jgi:hypothetical protein